MAARGLLVLACASAGAEALKALQLGGAGAAARLCSTPAAGRTEGGRASYYWSNKNGDAGGTGFSAHVGPSNVSSGPVWSWKDLTESLVSTHPLIDGERNVYLANRNGAVRKFKMSGETVWQNTDAFGGPVSAVLVGHGALMDGAVHVGFGDGSVASIDMESGRTRWKVKASAGAGPDNWSLMAREGVVVVAGRSEGWKRSDPDGGGNDQVVALDARDGRTLWTFRPQVPLFSFQGSFADGPPSLVFADLLGVPHRLALCDGRLLWRNAEGRGNATVSAGGAVVEASGDRVIVAGNDIVASGQAPRASVTAYDARSGARLWRHMAELPASAPPAVGSLQGPGGKASVVVAVGDAPGLPDPSAEQSGRYRDGRAVALASRVYALDAATGLPTGWDFAPPVYTKPAASGEQFPYFLCLPQAWSGAAIGGDGAVYLGHMSGRIFALRDRDGDGALRAEQGEVTEYAGGRCYQGAPGLAPGLLVATPCDGMQVFRA